MKRFVFVLAGILLVMMILSAGCSKPAPAPSAPVEKTGTGTLTDINTPAEAGADAITIKTPEGAATLPIAADATFSLNGQTCSLDQLAGLELAGVSYNCTYVYTWDPETTHEEIIAIDVTKTVPGK